MYAKEISMLLVKPDGVSKGLTESIRDIILSQGLIIIEEIDKILRPETAKKLYWDVSDVRHRDYFPQLTEFMSSSPVHIFIVEGANAVKTVRFIIGKREPPSGIRQLWAEDIIRNVAHGPDGLENAGKEIKIVLEREVCRLKKVFLIGGMSESGKSTLGRYFDSRGIKRLKITSFLQNIKDREKAEGDFVSWNQKSVKERPEWVREEFTKEFVAVTSKQGIDYCVLESLYGPELGLYMKEALGKDKAIIIYVNMDLDVRLQRQMIRQNLTSLEEAKSLLLPRDEIKREWRVPEIRDVADFVIDNSGSLDELYKIADKIIRQHCPEIP